MKRTQGAPRDGDRREGGVPAGRSKRSVSDEFDRIARRYDLLTTWNPGYRRHLALSARRMGVAPGARLLDLCCGTGLSTRALLAVYPSATIVGLDASAGMLSVARRKVVSRRVRFLEGDAMDPRSAGVEDDFDGIFMAYGIRNMSDPDTCLGRIRELLAPGGVACFHEYSVADSRLARAVWNLVTLGVIIPAGGLLSGTVGIYRYLRRSVLEFDGVRTFEERLRRAGFSEVHTEPMDGWQNGIVHSFLCTRPR